MKNSVTSSLTTVVTPVEASFSWTNPKLSGGASMDTGVTYEQQAKFRRAEQLKSDRLLEQAQYEMVKSQRMLDIALKFVDRMKQAGAIDVEGDDDERQYANYIYNMLMEGQQLENIEEDMVAKKAKATKKGIITMETNSLRQLDTLRVSLLTSLKHNDPELELIEKAGRPTYFVDGSIEVNQATGGDYSSRKIRCTQDPETLKNEVYEVGYNEDNTDDLRDPVERNELDLSKVNRGYLGTRGVA